MSLADQLVQSNHATHTIAGAAGYEVDGIPNIILIGVPDTRALMRVAAKLADNAIPHCAWREPDLDLGFTAISTIPLRPDQKQCLRNYRLWQPTSPTSSPTPSPTSSPTLAPTVSSSVAQLDRAAGGPQKLPTRSVVRVHPEEPVPECASSLVAQSRDF
jgi:hypothetical protein